MARYDGPLVLVGLGLEGLGVELPGPVEGFAEVFGLVGGIGVGPVLSEHQLHVRIVLLQALYPGIDIGNLPFVPAVLCQNFKSNLFAE